MLLFSSPSPVVRSFFTSAVVGTRPVCGVPQPPPPVGSWHLLRLLSYFMTSVVVGLFLLSAGLDFGCSRSPPPLLCFDCSFGSATLGHRCRVLSRRPLLYLLRLLLCFGCFGLPPPKPALGRSCFVSAALPCALLLMPVLANDSALELLGILG